MDLINFVQSSILGGIAYDAIKKVLGKPFEKLKNYLDNNETDKFQGALEILIESDEEIKNKLLELQQKYGDKNIVNQYHTGNGDNVAGNKNVISINGSNSGVINFGNNNEFKE